MRKTIIFGECASSEEFAELEELLIASGIKVMEADVIRAFMLVDTELDDDSIETLLFDNGFDCEGIRV